jgi:hypothetical protein
MDSSGNPIDPNAALPAGTNLIGKVGIDQTTVGTTNAVSLAQVGSTSVATGNGVTGAGSPRVTISSDNSEVPTKIADGSLVTLGSKADAATCATTNTMLACIRQLNTSINSSVPAGTNLIGNVGVAQATALGTTAGPLNQGSVTTAAPTYTTGNINPLSLTTAGGLRVDMSGTTAPLPTGAATSANQPTTVAVAGAATTGTGNVAFGAATTGAPTDTTGNSYPLSLTTSGGLRHDLLSINGTTVSTGTGAAGAGTQRVTVSTDTATIAGSAVGTAGTPSTNVVSIQGVASGTAVPVSFATINAFAGTTSTSTTGIMSFGASTTAAPAYTTGSNWPLSLATNGGLRVDLNSVAGTTIVTGGVAGSQSVGGTAAALAANTGNPVKTGLVYNTATTAATTGQIQNAAGDQFGNIGEAFNPSMAVQITGQSATTANTANVATLAAAAAKFTWIAGFSCTAGGATAGSLVTITVAGTITGSLTYTWGIPTGATLAATPFTLEFAKPIQSSAVNTAITVTAGAAGAGNTVQQCNAHGYQQ